MHEAKGHNAGFFSGRVSDAGRGGSSGCDACSKINTPTVAKAIRRDKAERTSQAPRGRDAARAVIACTRESTKRDHARPSVALCRPPWGREGEAGAGGGE